MNDFVILVLKVFALAYAGAAGVWCFIQTMRILLGVM